MGTVFAGGSRGICRHPFHAPMFVAAAKAGALGALLVAGPSARGQSCDPAYAGDLAPSDGVAQDLAGTSVDLRGELAIVGAPGVDGSDSDFGAAYVYRFDRDALWSEEAKLVPFGPLPDAAFGHAVAIEGEFAAVGAPLEDTTDGKDSGAVYLYRFDGTQWVEHARLASVSTGYAFANFGWSLAMQGDLLAVGAHQDSQRDAGAGAVYVYRFDGAAWTLETTLFADDADRANRLGSAVDFDRDVDGGDGRARLIAGATDTRFGGIRAGAAYVYERSADGAWTETARLLAPDRERGDKFGAAVALRGPLAAVGAVRDQQAGPLTGAAYTYRFADGRWGFEAKVVPADAAAFDHFGQAVGITPRGALIATAPFAGVGGTAYLHRFDSAAWIEESRFAAQGTQADDRFGSALAVDEDLAGSDEPSAAGARLLVGAPFRSGAGFASGAAHLFDLDCPPHLSVDAACPEGGPASVAWRGVTPNADLALLFARSTGAFVIPTGYPCAGTMLGLSDEELLVVWQGNAGPTGAASIEADAAADVCGGYLQLLDIKACTTSETRVIE